MLWQTLLIFYLSPTFPKRRGSTVNLSELFLVPQLKISRVLILFTARSLSKCLHPIPYGRARS